MAKGDSNPMSAPIFTAQGLTKTYGAGETEVRALRGIDLEIAIGEVVVLLGPSGSGKSTLLNIMGGLDKATGGRLFFKDIELTALGDTDLTAYRRRHVGFVFQFFNLVPSLTAYENVALVTEIAEEPMRPDEALALVGLQTAGIFGIRIRDQLGSRNGILRNVVKVSLEAFFNTIQLDADVRTRPPGWFGASVKVVLVEGYA